MGAFPARGARADEQHEARSSCSNEGFHKHIGAIQETERIVLLKTLMAHQTQELDAAVGSQVRRIAAVQKTSVANDKTSWKRRKAPAKRT